jgi:hypothetical protein
MATDNSAYFGQTDPTSAQGEWNQLRFIIRQQMAKLNTSLPVRVVAVDAAGLAPVGFVTIRILVDQLSGDDMAVPHGDIANVPYMRIQGGNNAVIIDPAVGDIGMACFCSRDISAVKNARKSAPPGSRRQYSFSDCMYVGGFLNGAPTQYIQFTEGGILLHSPGSIKNDAPVVQLGNVDGALRKLVDERLIPLFNAHQHGTSPVPNVQLTPATVLTVATEAN